jgi:CheY-like chemotaxis protein
MVEAKTRICEVRDLFSRMRDTAFARIAPECITVKMPEYLPPVVIPGDAERWMIFAGVLMTAWADAEVAIRATAQYEDHHDPDESAVLLSIEIRGGRSHTEATVESEWLQELGRLADELLVRSVELTLLSSANGIVFEFRLPVHGCGGQQPMHRDTILLVEDDEFVRRVAQEVLESSGHHVVVKKTAEEGLKFCEENRECVCLVISDVTLPGIDGKQLAAAVHASLPRIPVLLISGYSQSNCEDPLHGAYFLAKPFKAEALLAAAKQCVAASWEAAKVPPPVSAQRKPITAFC